MNKNHLLTESNPLVTRCWADEAFKQRLLAEPAATLKAEGFILPEGLTIRVFEDIPNAVNFLLPPQPPGFSRELSDQQLETVAGGGFKQDVKKFLDDVFTGMTTLLVRL